MSRKTKQETSEAALALAAQWDAAHPDLAPTPSPEPEQPKATKRTRKPKATKQAKTKAEPKAVTPALTKAERRAIRDAKDAEIRAAGQVVLNAAKRPTARGLTCLCGCEQLTHTEEAWFLSGHDAILRRQVLREGAELPAIIRPFFELGITIAGMVLVDGQIVDVKRGGPEF